jgi:hypothetical protein
MVFEDDKCKATIDSNIVLPIISSFIVVCALSYWENSKSCWNELELLWKPNWIGVIDMPPYTSYGKLSSNWEDQGMFMVYTITYFVKVYVIPLALVVNIGHIGMCIFFKS